MCERENKNEKSKRDKSSDGVTNQLTYFAHAHSVLANTKTRELRYYIYCANKSSVYTVLIYKSSVFVTWPYSGHTRQTQLRHILVESTYFTWLTWMQIYLRIIYVDTTFFFHYYIEVLYSRNINVDFMWIFLLKLWLIIQRLGNIVMLKDILLKFFNCNFVSEIFQKYTCIMSFIIFIIFILKYYNIYILYNIVFEIFLKSFRKIKKFAKKKIISVCF